MNRLQFTILMLCRATDCPNLPVTLLPRYFREVAGFPSFRGLFLQNLLCFEFRRRR